MYRPKGWEKALLEEVKKIPDPELLKGDMTKALLLFSEAGADAMLQGIAIELKRLDTKEAFYMFDFLEMLKKQLVFIPEEV